MEQVTTIIDKHTSKRSGTYVFLDLGVFLMQGRKSSKLKEIIDKLYSVILLITSIYQNPPLTKGKR